MAFDIDIIKKVYQQMPDRVDQARKIVGRPLTLSENTIQPSLGSENKQSFRKR